jgi:hydroxymethylpyrimidine pyrophosphatase-like HAD family hydrolase
MKWRALATDYDGTIAHDGTVGDWTVAALRRWRRAGLRAILVTGRELPSLFATFAQAELFDRIVAENGAVLWDSFSGGVQHLSPPPPQVLLERLQRSRVPISVGHSIVATATLYEEQARRALYELTLDWHVVLNKDAVMVLPRGVSKATGLAAALRELQIRAEDTVAVGDAENDLDFLRVCGLAVAVGNALDEVKAAATVTMTGEHGHGVRELIERLLAGELTAGGERTRDAAESPGHDATERPNS